MNFQRVRYALYSAGNVIFGRPKRRLRGEDSPARYVPVNQRAPTNGYGGNTAGTYSRTANAIAIDQSVNVNPAIRGRENVGIDPQDLVDRRRGVDN
jgi:hypothetical protein